MLKDNLKAFREARGLSQEQLAQKLHVVRQTVSKWERGSSVPDADMVVTLAAVFDTDVSTLLGETPNTERPVEALAIQSTLDAQNAAQLARTWRWAKAGFAILGALCICLILTTGLFARDFFRLYDGAQNGYKLQGTYRLMEDLGKERWLMGATLSFGEIADEGFDGFWQLSGYWDGEPMTGTTLKHDGEAYGIQWDYSRSDPVINGGYVRTEDPNVVILQDQNHNAVGWAHAAYTLGNRGDEGLLFAEYQGIQMRLPKVDNWTLHEPQELKEGTISSAFAPEGLEGSVSADTWFLSDEEWTARETADIPPSPSDADGEWE